jgi:hypothetical protein
MVSKKTKKVGLKVLKFHGGGSGEAVANSLNSLEAEVGGSSGG